jgi:cellulose synthase/poly-beta-1,6-N-acetylglucosamine synthase-like glycosyltransferase
VNEAPVLSVVVIGRNEGQRLVRCLHSVAEMKPLEGPVEIIYVDTESVDGSAERAADLGARVIQVRSPRPCASIGRNAGWHAARAAIVLFLDGDTILSPDFVAQAYDQFQDPRVAVVFGDRREIDTDSIYNRVLDLDWIPAPGPEVLCGGDALIRRETLERAGGYDETLIAGEDPELCLRIRTLGYKIVRLDRRMVGHDLAIVSFSQYWRRSVRTGYAYAEVSERSRHTDHPLWDREARRNRLHGIMMLGVVAGLPILGLAIRSLVPMLSAIAVVIALSIRTAIRSRWRCPELGTRLLYGIHSHLSQIPIFIGQLKYYKGRLIGTTAELIEYKNDTAS